MRSITLLDLAGRPACCPDPHTAAAPRPTAAHDTQQGSPATHREACIEYLHPLLQFQVLQTAAAAAATRRMRPICVQLTPAAKRPPHTTTQHWVWTTTAQPWTCDGPATTTQAGRQVGRGSCCLIYKDPSPHLTDGLVQGLVRVRRPPEELWGVQHTAQQVDSRLRHKEAAGSRQSAAARRQAAGSRGTNQAWKFHRVVSLLLVWTWKAAGPIGRRNSFSAGTDQRPVARTP